MSTTYQSLHLARRPEASPVADDFALRTHNVEPLADGQIRVRVQYVSLDPAMRVWMSEQKSYWPPIPLDDVMRAFALGEIVESNNPRFAVGDYAGGMFGVTELATSDGKGVRAFNKAQLPDPKLALSALGATGLTAYFGLADIGKPQAGEVVVVSAAAGAVGSMALQIAKQRGARVIGIAGGPEKCAYLKNELGADEVIDYKHERIGEALHRTCPKGIDVYFDNVGGEILDAVLKRLRLKARIVLCGGISQYNATGPVSGPANYLALISARAKMEGFVVIDYLDRADEALAEIVPWMLAGKIKQQSDVIDGIDNFVVALNRLFEGKNHGKQLLQLYAG